MFIDHTLNKNIKYEKNIIALSLKIKQGMANKRKGDALLVTFSYPF